MSTWWINMCQILKLSKSLVKHWIDAIVNRKNTFVGGKQGKRHVHVIKKQENLTFTNSWESESVNFVFSVNFCYQRFEQNENNFPLKTKTIQFFPLQILIEMIFCSKIRTIWKEKFGATKLSQKIFEISNFQNFPDIQTFPFSSQSFTCLSHKQREKHSQQ